MTDQNLARAAELAPLIERVHGENHPELTRVREITLALQEVGNGTRTVELFNELRTVTQDYALPDDACEAFEATYQALERADRQRTA
nr:iron-sulfur cluster repair di-iron protein, ric [Actinomycetales bacterium]